ncbi:glycosyltransferase family 2 protein [Lacibacter sp.]|uniref:glycosyltransferase family 2 protein n=1 Tax=Lacibacter sp. TaxID=1915409 RepID=UPI002B4AD64C|nr:glycosyltransferase [Lacibacter sp.]HLP36092.1 glycosyltransferase [Lacibacter sp.]
MAEPIISVIVPVYNAGPYLEACILSILQQGFSELEIIAINDGSTDNSAVLLDQLAADDSRLRVFHNRNQGVSATRNFGLQHAKGSYIAFCDADDWMEPEMLETLYEGIVNDGCDWAICNANMIKEGALPIRRLNIANQVVDVNSNRAAFVHAVMRFNYDYANWNKLFKASIIKEQQLRFSEEMSIGEDLLFNLQYLCFVNKAVIADQLLYNYRIVGNSLYNSNSENRIPHFNLLFKNYAKFYDLQKNEEQWEAFREEMGRIAYNQLLWEIEMRVKTERHSFLRTVRNYRNELKQVEPGLFYYPDETVSAFQGIKKRLLANRQFNLFSILIALKQYLKPVAKRVRLIFKSRI